MTLSDPGPKVDIVDVFYLPRSCWGCQVLLPSESKAPHLCQKCNLGISPLEPRPHQNHEIIALYPYQGVMAKLLAQLKFQGKRSAARPLGELLYQAPANPLRSKEAFTHLVPLPLHWKRQLYRGFNQCELILNWAFPKLPSAPTLLTKRRHTPPQRSLSRQDRQDNLTKAFVVHPGAQLPPDAKILVVDDVTTTGATLHTALQVLRDAGFRDCQGLALMQADKVEGPDISNAP